MAAFPTPPGVTIAAVTPAAGSPTVLVAVPVGGNYIPAEGAGSTVPTEGQVWPSAIPIT